MPALNRPLRCNGCGKASRDYSQTQQYAPANERVCLNCEQQHVTANAEHREAHMDSVARSHYGKANHQAAFETKVAHRCVVCNTATHEFTPEQAAKTAEERVCSACIHKGVNPQDYARTKATGAPRREAPHPEAHPDEYHKLHASHHYLQHHAGEDLHEAAKYVPRNYFCTGCGVATQDMRMEMIAGDINERLCLECEENGVAPGTIIEEHNSEVREGSAEEQSPLGNRVQYALHRSERAYHCTGCGMAKRDFSAEQEEGDPNTRLCLECEEAIAEQYYQEQQAAQQAQEDAEAAEAQQRQQQMRQLTPQRGGGGGQGTLTAAGCIKRAMRCSVCHTASKQYTIDQMLVDPSARCCIPCMMAQREQAKQQQQQ